MPVHSTKCQRLVLCGLAAALLAAGGHGRSAGAEETGKQLPRLEALVDIEVEDDWTFDSDDPDAELNDLYTTTEPALDLFLLPGLSLHAGLVLEPVLDPGPGEDRFFEDHGLYAEELFALYEHDLFHLIGGKLNLPFGVAWDLAPGVYGSEIAEDFYERTEMIGAGGGLNFGGDGIGGEGFGEHTLAGRAFFVDTSFLSGSAITSRGRTRRDDGGIGNTGDPASFVIALDGGSFPGIPGDLGYHLATIYSQGGEGDPEDELGFAAGLYGSFTLSEDWAIEPIVEVVHFENADGLDQSRDLVTVGAGLLHGPWNLALAYGASFSDPDGAAIDDLDVHLYQVSAGYSFDFGLDVDLGYKFVEEEGVGSHTVGILFHTCFDLIVPSRVTPRTCE